MKTLVLIFILFFSISTQAQIKDFFLPETKSTILIQPSSIQEEGIMDVWSFRHQENPNKYIVTKTTFLKGKTSSRYTYYIELSNNQIKIYKEDFTNIFGMSDSKTDISRIVLKHPINGKVEEWQDVDSKTNYNKCKSELCKIKINGIETDAIKLTKTPIENGRELTNWGTNNYYAKGYGLVCIELTNGLIHKIIKEHNSVPIDIQLYSKETQEVTNTQQNKSTPIDSGSKQQEDSSNTKYKTLDRKIIEGTFKQPKHEVDEYGTVVIDLIINPTGDVVEAKVAKSTTTKSPALINESLKVARQIKFEKVDINQNENRTITYTFNLK